MGGCICVSYFNSHKRRSFVLKVHYSKEWVCYAFIPMVYCPAHAGEQQGNGSNCQRWQFWKRCSPSLSEKFSTLTKLNLFQEKDNPGACLPGFGKGLWTPRSGGQVAQLENTLWKYRKHRVPQPWGIPVLDLLSSVRNAGGCFSHPPEPGKFLGSAHAETVWSLNSGSHWGISADSKYRTSLVLSPMPWDGFAQPTVQQQPKFLTWGYMNSQTWHS